VDRAVNAIQAEEHFRRLERLYRSAPINQIYQPTIRVSEGRAVVAMIMGPQLHHAAHAVHGSVYFKALDDAAFFAANSTVTDVFVLTVTYNVVLMRPVTEGAVTASGHLVNASRNLLVAEAELRDEHDKLLARGSGTFMRSTIALDPSVGYE
jgi:uncharacterized protein (TIGR00369 family)